MYKFHVVNTVDSSKGIQEVRSRNKTGAIEIEVFISIHSPA
jgi:hypothetical protein